MKPNLKVSSDQHLNCAGTREITRPFTFDMTFELHITPCRQRTEHLKALIQLQGLTIGVTPLLLPIFEILLEVARVPFIQADTSRNMTKKNESVKLLIEMNEISMLFFDDLGDICMGSLGLKLENLTCTSTTRPHMNTLEISTNQLCLFVCSRHDYELSYEYLPLKICLGIDKINAFFKLNPDLHALMKVGSIGLNLSPTFNFLVLRNVEVSEIMGYFDK